MSIHQHLQINLQFTHRLVPKAVVMEPRNWLEGIQLTLKLKIKKENCNSQNPKNKLIRFKINNNNNLEVIELSTV